MGTMSSLVERLKLATLAGRTFGGKRNLYEVFGYTPNLGYQNFVAKYARQDIAQRVVNAPAAATWRGDPIVDGGPEFNRRWRQLVAKHDAYQMLERVDKLAGIGYYATLYIGFDDNNASTPEKPVQNAQDILFMQPYGEGNSEILEIDDNPTSPNFGYPLLYQLDVTDPQSLRNTHGHSTKSIVVHASRVLHVAENVLTDNIYGTPRLEHVYNLLDDLLKVVGGSAETFWLVANRGIQADVDKEMELSTDDAKALQDELEEYQHELRRFIRTRGVDLKPLTSQTSDGRGPFEMIMALLSGATGIPQRILMGSEAGQLASEQDRANWADRIAERQRDFAWPHILKPFIYKLVASGLLPQPDADDEDAPLTIEWPEAFIMSPLERAQEMAQKARAATNFSKSLGGVPIATVEESRQIMGLSSIPEEGTLEPEVEPEVEPPMPPQMPPTE